MDNKGYEQEMENVKEKPLQNGTKSLETGNDYKQSQEFLSSFKADDLSDPDEDQRCGFGCFSPKWAQQFATKKSFMVVFSLLGVIQGMSWSYFTATISTLEKRFKISSETTGIVMTGNEVSQIIFSIFLSHYGATGHRPRWIAVGTLLSALACFVLSSPHFLYGSGKDALILTENYAWLSQNVEDAELQYIKSTTSFRIEHNSSGIPIDVTSKPGIMGMIGDSNKKKISKVSLCRRNDVHQVEQCDSEGASLPPLILIFLSQFVSGIGILLFFTLGGPYLDDNTKRKNVAMLFGITMSLRLVGPTLGFLLASGTLKMYINPLLSPIITPEDPRWTGAWWLGWVLIGSWMAVFSFIIALFPRTLRGSGETSSEVEDKSTTTETVPKLSEIPKALKLLLKNKVNVYNNLAAVFYLFAGIGYWTYMPKYMETIFMQTASTASIFSGVVGIFTQATGMLLSGFLISRFQFSARKLAGWNVITGFAHIVTIIGCTQIGCDVGEISFGTENKDRSWNLTSICNSECNCKTSKILPVCYKEANRVFYSACHAGCESFDGERIGNCSCISDPLATVTLGNCSVGCNEIFMIFLAISALIKFIDATGRIGNMLISYRCVKLEERSLSIGLNILLLSALALLPAPIIFGRIIDSVCLVWGGEACGKRGNCMLYDGKQLRYIFNVFAAGFVTTGVLFDCLVCYHVKNLDLYEEPASVKDAEVYRRSFNIKRDSVCA